MESLKRSALKSLFCAVECGDLTKLRMYAAEGLDLDEYDNDGMTTSILAALCGQGAVLQALYELGADVNKLHAETGATSLCVAAQEGQ